MRILAAIAVIDKGPRALRRTAGNGGRETDPSQRMTAAFDASGASGQSSSGRLRRSQVLSLLRSDCQALAESKRREINLLVLHCSDTRPSQSYTLEMLKRDHARRGFGEWPGYHVYVRRDGTVHYCRPVSVMGCHVKGYNRNSIGVCYEGGHSDNVSPKYEDNRTAEQQVALSEIFALLHACWPNAKIVGHHELNPLKACPCLERAASIEYAYILKA